MIFYPKLSFLLQSILDDCVERVERNDPDNFTENVCDSRSRMKKHRHHASSDDLLNDRTPQRSYHPNFSSSTMKSSRSSSSRDFGDGRSRVSRVPPIQEFENQPNYYGQHSTYNTMKSSSNSQFGYPSQTYGFEQANNSSRYNGNLYNFFFKIK